MRVEGKGKVRHEFRGKKFERSRQKGDSDGENKTLCKKRRKREGGSEDRKGDGRGMSFLFLGFGRWEGDFQKKKEAEGLSYDRSEKRSR